MKLGTLVSKTPLHLGAHWWMLAVTALLFVLVAVFVDLKPVVAESFFFSTRDPGFGQSKDRETLSVATAAYPGRVFQGHFITPIPGPDPKAHSTGPGDRRGQHGQEFDRRAKEFSGCIGEPVLEPAVDSQRQIGRAHV